QRLCSVPYRFLFTKPAPTATGAQGIQRERRIADSIPLRNAWRQCQAGEAFASKMDFLSRGGQGDNKKASPLGVAWSSDRPLRRVIYRSAAFRWNVLRRSSSSSIATNCARS